MAKLERAFNKAMRVIEALEKRRNQGREKHFSPSPHPASRDNAAPPEQYARVRDGLLIDEKSRAALAAARRAEPDFDDEIPRAVRGAQLRDEWKIGTGARVEDMQRHWREKELVQAPELESGVRAKDDARGPRPG